MKILKSTREVRGVALAIGNFDAVHLGHQAMLRRLRRESDRRGIEAAVLSFFPHPREVLGRGQVVPRICTDLQRQRVFRSLGVDVWIQHPFDLAFSKVEGVDFVRETLLRQWRVPWVVVGEDFRFGAGRRADAQQLAQWCAAEGATVHIESTVTKDGERISSSAIRDFLMRGDVGQAMRWLGRAFVYTGTVKPGQQLARTWNFPTANFPRPEGLVALPFGVYVTEMVLDAGEPRERRYRAVTNVGVRPTVGGSETSGVLVESHCLDQTLELYGKSIDVEFLAMLRPEQKFDGLEALRAQIRRDVEQARAWSMIK